MDLLLQPENENNRRFSESHSEFRRHKKHDSVLKTEIKKMHQFLGFFCHFARIWQTGIPNFEKLKNPKFSKATLKFEDRKSEIRFWKVRQWRSINFLGSSAILQETADRYSKLCKAYVSEIQLKKFAIPGQNIARCNSGK
jgi:hypothetical protein